MSFKRALNAAHFLIGGIAWLFAFGFLWLLLLLLGGCTSTPRPKVIVQEVKIPVICPVKMPARPKNSGDFESHKALMIYFLECEALLKHCTTVLTSREDKASAYEQGRERPLQSPKVTGLRGRNPALADLKEEAKDE